MVFFSLDTLYCVIKYNNAAFCIKFLKCHMKQTFLHYVISCYRLLQKFQNLGVALFLFKKCKNLVHVAMYKNLHDASKFITYCVQITKRGRLL